MNLARLSFRQLLFTMTSRIVRTTALPVVVGVISSLLLGASVGQGADASSNVTTVLLAEGDNALSAAVQLGSDEAWATLTIRLDDGKSHIFRGRVESDRIRQKATENGATVWNEVTLPDAAVNFPGWFVTTADRAWAATRASSRMT
jgi:hypothetical protein